MVAKQAFAGAVMLGFLSGCVTGQDTALIEHRPAPQVDRATFHQILENGGSDSQIDKAHAFLRAFDARYGDVLYLTGGATAQRHAVATALSRAYPALKVRTRSDASPKPLTVSLERAVVLARECPYFSRPVEDGADHVPLPGYGCATDLSLAQMVADPRDLKSGKGGASVDAEVPTDTVQAVREERFSVTVGDTTTTGTSSSSSQ